MISYYFKNVCWYWLDFVRRTLRLAFHNPNDSFLLWIALFRIFIFCVFKYMKFSFICCAWKTKYSSVKQQQTESLLSVCTENGHYSCPIFSAWKCLSYLNSAVRNENISAPYPTKSGNEPYFLWLCLTTWKLEKYGLLILNLFLWRLKNKKKARRETNVRSSTKN